MDGKMTGSLVTASTGKKLEMGRHDGACVDSHGIALHFGHVGLYMMSWRMCNTVHAIYTSNHNNNNNIIIITHAMQGSKSPSKLALEMNEGITLIQGNTCLKPKIKSNNSAPVE